MRLICLQYEIVLACFLLIDFYEIAYFLCLSAKNGMTSYRTVPIIISFHSFRIIGYIQNAQLLLSILFTAHLGPFKK